MIKQETTVSGYRFGRFLSFFIFIIFGLAVFLPSMPYSALIADSLEIVIRTTLVTVSIGVYFLLKEKDGQFEIATLILAFGVAAIAMALSWQYGNFLFDAFNGNIKTMRGIALAKAGSAVTTLLPIVVLLPLFYRRGIDFFLTCSRESSDLSVFNRLTCILFCEPVKADLAFFKQFTLGYGLVNVLQRRK